MSTSYRLPDWLGGHVVEIVDEHDNGDYTVKTLADVDGARQRVRVGRGVLVEMKPPSIDDPEPLPFKMHCMAGGLHVDVSLEDWPDGALLTIDDSDDAMRTHMTAHGLRRLARAAWQRANAVEAAGA